MESRIHHVLFSIFLILLASMNVAVTDALATPSTKGSANNNEKMRILCLHGAMQSAATFSSKIGGARRKIERVYDLHFINGPIAVESNSITSSTGTDNANIEKLYVWWTRDEASGRHQNVREAFDYILQETNGQSYDAILGFSQGGTLATALAISGVLPSVRTVVTAGAPYVEEAFRVAMELAGRTHDNEEKTNIDQLCRQGMEIPKFHFVGERDEMVPVESTRALSKHGGNGILEVHDQGHLFPTRAARVQQVLEFLEEAMSVQKVVK